MGKIGKWQSFVIYSLFMFGGIFTIGGSNEAGRDSWLAFLLGGLIAVPLYLVYLKIASEDNSIGKKAFGEKIGSAVGILYIVFAIYSAVTTQSIFTLFLTDMSLVNTPKFAVGALIAITVIYMCSKGVSTIARVCEMVFPFVFTLVFLSTAAAIPQMDIGHMLPVAYSGGMSIVNGVYTSLFLPFLEGFFAIFVITKYSSHSPKKSVILSTIMTTIMICVVFIKNIGVVGWPMAAMMYFPSYTVASILTMGSFFQRIEVFVSISFMVCQIVKIAVLIVFATDTIKEVFPRAKKETVNMSLGLAVFVISLVQFKGITQAFESLQSYRYYNTIPLLVLPFVILIAQKVKAKRKLKNKSNEKNIGEIST